MRQFQSIVCFLFALVAFAFANPQSYDATVYITSTVYRVNTVTMSGSPTVSVANSTSTISVASVGTILPNYPSSNATLPGTGVPSHTAAASQPAFTGAASQMNVNAFVAVLAAGVGYLAL